MNSALNVLFKRNLILQIGFLKSGLCWGEIPLQWEDQVAVSLTWVLGLNVGTMDQRTGWDAVRRAWGPSGQGTWRVWCLQWAFKGFENVLREKRCDQVLQKVNNCECRWGIQGCSLTYASKASVGVKSFKRETGVWGWYRERSFRKRNVSDKVGAPGGRASGSQRSCPGGSDLENMLSGPWSADQEFYLLMRRTCSIHPVVSPSSSPSGQWWGTDVSQRLFCFQSHLPSPFSILLLVCEPSHMKRWFNTLLEVPVNQRVSTSPRLTRGAPQTGAPLPHSVKPCQTLGLKVRLTRLSEHWIPWPSYNALEASAGPALAPPAQCSCLPLLWAPCALWNSLCKHPAPCNACVVSGIRSTMPDPGRRKDTCGQNWDCVIDRENLNLHVLQCRVPWPSTSSSCGKTAPLSKWREERAGWAGH